MYCSKCGLELPEGAKTCPKCGMAEETTEAGQQAARKKKMIITTAAVASALLVIIMVAVLAVRAGKSNVTSVPGQVSSPPGNLMSAPPGSPSNGRIMSAPPGQPAAGDTTPASTQKQKPPQNVVYYLNFVKQVEEIREKLIVNSDLDKELLQESGKMLANLFDMAGNADAPDDAPMGAIKDKVAARAKVMLETLKVYDKAAAPPECREFSGAYRKLLYLETKTLYDASNMVGNAKQDWYKFQEEAGKMKADPTISDANVTQISKDADAQLDNLVSNYDMEKPFEIKPEKQGSGSIMGF